MNYYSLSGYMVVSFQDVCLNPGFPICCSGTKISSYVNKEPVLLLGAKSAGFNDNWLLRALFSLDGMFFSRT